MAGMWDYKFNSSDGPVEFNSDCAEDELDIIELGYNVMFASASENDYGDDFASQTVRMRANRATTGRWSSGA